MHVHHRTCPLCEALCGLQITLDGDRVRSVRGDPDDVLSAGHVCPKGVALPDLHDDPDRLRTPVRRTASGWEPLSWRDAVDLAARRLHAVQVAHGRHALGVYLGNPNVHHVGNLLGLAAVAGTLRTRNRFSATSADQLPHMHTALRMFGHQLLLPVPDLDRTALLLIIGANPWASNGSLMTAGDVRRRITAIRHRGGRVLVLDPRRTETAEAADQHLAPWPGTDALVLLGMLHVLFAEDRIAAGPWRAFTDGLPALRAAAARFPPERSAATTGISADEVRALARALSEAPSAAVYARFGACTQPYGGLVTWLAVALTLVTGNLDRAGGLMWTTPALDLVGLTDRLGQRGHHGAWHSRISGLPEFGGELPVAALAEEIETPGARQVRALLTVAGNPVLSTPHGARLDTALAGLEFMVSLDPYVNETTRHAHLILPPLPPLSRHQLGAAMQALAVRNVAKAAPPLLPAEPDLRDDWDTLLALAERLERHRRRLPAALTHRALRTLGLPRVIDLLLRVGPHGARTPWGTGLSLSTLTAASHGVDLGPLTPRLPGALRTADRKVHAAPDALLSDLDRLEAALQDGSLAPGGLALIGRRQLRSNNSWMHNSRRLMTGKERCTLEIHPTDAEARGLEDGAVAEVRSATGAVRVPVTVTDAVRPGVVSLPHGWGHGRPGVRLAVASSRPGVSLNDLTDETRVDRLTGTAAFSGVPVEVAPPDLTTDATPT